MTFEELEAGYSAVLALEQQRRLRDAAQLARTLVSRLQEERGLDTNWGLLMEKSGDLEMALGRYSVAASYYRAVSLNRAADDSDAHRHAVFKWLAAELAQGNCAADEPLAAIEALVGPLEDIPVESPEALTRFWATLGWPPLAQAHACLVLGRLLASLGQYAAARNLLSQGRGDSDTMERLLGQVAAVIAMEAGDLRGAEALLSADDNASGERAKLLYTLGRLGDALAVADQEVLRASKSRSTIQLARALLNRAALRVPLNQTFEAREDAAFAVELASGDLLCENMARLVVEAASTRDGSGVHDLIGWTALALQIGRNAVRQARVPFELPSARPASFLAYYETEEASLLRRCGTQASAFATALDELRMLFGNTDSAWIQRRLRALNALQAWLEGQLETAARAWEQIGEEWRREGAVMEAYQLDRWRREAIGGSPDLDGSLDRDLAQLALSMPQSGRASFLLDKWTSQERSCDERAQEILDGLRQSKWPWPLRLWGQAIRLTDTSVSNSSAFAAECHGRTEGAVRTPLGLWSAWHRCRRDEAVVATITLPSRTVFCLWRWGHVQVWDAPLSRLDLRTLVQRFHWHLAGTEDEDAARSQALLQTLAERSGLAPRLMRLPKCIRRVCVLADDQWHKVPLAAMPLSADSLLVDRFAVRLDFSWPPVAHAPRTKGAAIVASVSQGAEDVSVLARARSEANWVSAWCERQGYSPVESLDAEQVTREYLARALPQAGLFHFAGHGGFESNRGAGSGLVLHRGMDQFTFADAAALPPVALRLVVLMACHGADGLVFPGRIVTSFPQLLRQAGAAAVIAPLWEIRDDVAQRFTHLLYQARASSRTDDALRQALVALRSEFTGLGQWASLQLYGEGA